VDSAIDYFDNTSPLLVSDPPVLDGSALRASCENEADGTLDKLEAGQKALVDGEMSLAMAIMEPIASRHPHAAALAGIISFALGRRSYAIGHFDTISRIIPKDSGPSLYWSLANLGRWLVKSDRSMSLEADYMSLLCHGVGIDVGCGGFKTCPQAIGVDLTAGGAEGSAGGQASVKSQADITASGDYLPMFETGQLDFVIARHNLEHYQDHVKALLEWTRVLKPGGMIGVITPDHDWVDTIRLDSTHYHVFTKRSLERLFGLLPGIETAHVGIAAERWSIMAIARKTPEDRCYDYLAHYNQRESDRCQARAEEYLAEGNIKMAAQCRAESERLARAIKTNDD